MAKNAIVIFLSGVQGDNINDMAVGGNTMPATDLQDLMQLKQPSPYNVIIKGWFGSIKRKDFVVSTVYADIGVFLDYQPGDSLLAIYGYSAGGMNALNLCRRFDQHNRGNAKKIVVDLLITVDAAAREETTGIDRRLADCVKENLNYYQLSSSWSGSVGGQNVGNGHCTPENVLLATTHAAIRELTWPNCLWRIKDFLKVTSSSPRSR